MIEIYSRENCSYCDRAKALMRDRQIPFVEYKLDVDFTREHLLEMYSEAKTFPVIIVDGFFIGGYTELVVQLNEEVKNTQKLLNEGTM
jgi:glutaredoxin